MVNEKIITTFVQLYCYGVMKRFLVSLALLVMVINLSAQTGDSPFAKFGYKKDITYTMSKGEFDEFHDQTEVVEIGNVFFSTRTNQIVGFVNDEEENAALSAATPALQIDPLAAKYYWITPYAFCMNNPIRFIDPDGRAIKGVTYKNGEFIFSKSAIRNGTDRYVNARITTDGGRSSIMSLVNDKKTYSLMVTDKVLVLPTEKGKYAISGGGTDPNARVIVVTTNGATPENVTSEQLQTAVTVNSKGNLIPAKVNEKNLDTPLTNSNPNAPYSAAYRNSGMEAFDAANPYKSAEEQIHGVGAHEETHLKPGNIDAQNRGDVYNAEKEAFEAEKKAREDYIEKYR